jgi:hypothetical protein
MLPYVMRAFEHLSVFLEIVPQSSKPGPKVMVQITEGTSDIVKRTSVWALCLAVIRFHHNRHHHHSPHNALAHSPGSRLGQDKCTELGHDSSQRSHLQIIAIGSGALTFINEVSPK